MRETNEKIDGFFANYRPIEYRAKETVIHMSDEPTGVYYVRSGFVKMNTILPSGNEMTLNIFKPGSFFPMAWALAKTKNNFHYQTITAVSVYKAPQKEVIRFLKSDREVLFDLTKRVFSGMDGLLGNFANYIFGNSSNRVASALVLCIKRFGEKNGGKIILNIRLTHQDIANIAGLTRETTSGVMGILKKSHIISKKNGKIIIINPDKLKKLSQVTENPSKLSDMIQSKHIL